MPLANKILFGIIGALLALAITIIAVMLATKSIGAEAMIVIILLINGITSFMYWKKLHKNEIVRSIAKGAFYGSITFLVLFYITKTVVFSLLSGITS